MDSAYILDTLNSNNIDPVVFNSKLCRSIHCKINGEGPS